MTETSIAFPHTGHFWNDLGVMGVWRWLVEGPVGINRQDDGGYVVTVGHCQCTLNGDELRVTGQEADVYDLLQRAVDALREQAWQPTKKGKMSWAGPASFLYAGQTNPNFLLPYEGLAEKQRKSGRCDVCGKESVSVRATGVSYNPLLVSLDRMSSFYSELRGALRICQSCAFTAPFALTQAWYSWNNEFLSLTLLWPSGTDLLGINDFLGQTSRFRVGDSVWRNYKRAFASANSPAACFVNLVCALWDVSRTETSADALARALNGIQFHAMQLSKAGKTSRGFSVDRYVVIPDPAGVLRLVKSSDRVSKQGKAWNALASVLGDMTVTRHVGGKIQTDSRLLDEIADAIVGRAPIERILEERIYEALDQLRVDAVMMAPFSVVAFRLLVPVYFKEVKDMATDLLPALQSVGETLGELINITDDRSVLYNLRNARSVDDLLEVLSRAIVRHTDAFIEGQPELWRNRVRELAQSIDASNWRRVRSLLGLYAGLKLIELSKPQGNTAPTTKA